MANLIKLSELAELTGQPVQRLRFWARLRLFPTTQCARLRLVDPEEFARWFDSRRQSKDHAN